MQCSAGKTVPPHLVRVESQTRSYSHAAPIVLQQQQGMEGERDRVLCRTLVGHLMESTINVRVRRWAGRMRSVAPAASTVSRTARREVCH